MAFTTEWDAKALKALRKLDPTTRLQILRKLKERLDNPRVPGAKLHGLKDCYKIKLKALGYRLVYQVIDQRLVVYVLSVGRRDDDETYGAADKRRRPPT